MIKGSYSLDDIVRLYSNSAQIDDEDIRMHELTHRSIMQQSNMGAIMLSLRDIATNFSMDLTQTIKLLVDSCERLNELTALYVQIITYKIMIKYDGGIIDYSFIKNLDYYKKYSIDGFDYLITLDPVLWDEKLVLPKIAKWAMNIDIRDKNINWFDTNQIIYLLLESPMRYRPDFRFVFAFKKFIEVLKSDTKMNWKQFKEMISIEDEMDDKDNRVETLKHLKKQLLSVKPLLNVSSIDVAIYQVVNNLYPNKEVDWKQWIIPQFPRHDNVETKYTFEKNDYNATSVAYIINLNAQTHAYFGDNDVLILHNFIDGSWKHVVTSREEIVSFLQKYEYTLIVYNEDHEYVNSSKKRLFNQKNVFYLYEGAYFQLKKYLDSKTKGEKYIFFQFHIRTGIFFVFIKEKELSDIFFTMQYEDTIYLIIEDIKNGEFTYVNSLNGIYDDIFYTDNNTITEYGFAISHVADLNIKNEKDGEHIWGARLSLDLEAENPLFY